MTIKQCLQQQMSQSIQHVNSCLVCRKLEVKMPKFNMEQSYSLHNLLPDMGMTSVFNNLSNLTKLTEDKGLKLSEVSCHFRYHVAKYVPVPQIVQQNTFNLAVKL